MVEQDLERLMRHRLHRKDDETWALITGENGPLRSFHTKILGAYALGMFDSATLDNLQIVRRIRNGFAHAKKPLDFKNKLVTDELSKIRPPSKGPRKAYLYAARGDREPREGYAMLCLLLSKLMAGKMLVSLKAKQKRVTRQKLQPRAIANILLAQLSSAERAQLSTQEPTPPDHQSEHPKSAVSKESLDIPSQRVSSPRRNTGR
jgi:hypothetical protein